jgi:hypothetical protein
MTTATARKPRRDDVPTFSLIDLKPERVFPGLYLVGPVAVSRECEDWSCGCERYAIRPRTDDGIEMGDWITTRRHLKDALAVAQEYAKELDGTEQVIA